MIGLIFHLFCKVLISLTHGPHVLRFMHTIRVEDYTAASFAYSFDESDTDEKSFL